MKNGIKTEFSEALIASLEKDQPAYIMDYMSEYLQDRLKESKINPTGVDFSLTGSFDKDVVTIYGKDFKSEMLLLGFHCPDAKFGTALVWKEIAYYYNIEGYVKDVELRDLILRREYISPDQVLCLAEKEMLKRYKEKLKNEI